MNRDIVIPQMRALPEVVTPFHELLGLVAQEVLDSFWTAMPAHSVPASVLREAARCALIGFHRDGIPESALPGAFREALPAGRRNDGGAFLDRILWRDQTWHFGLWQDAVSPHQWQQDVLPMSPETVAIVMPAYRSDVVRIGRAIDDALRGHVRDRPLSDWDSALHAAYGFCFEASGEWPESMTLLKLHQIIRDALFEQYLRRSVLSLSDAEQHAMGNMVRAFWADLWSDDVPVQYAGLAREKPEDAADIPDARELLSGTSSG